MRGEGGSDVWWGGVRLAALDAVRGGSGGGSGSVPVNAPTDRQDRGRYSALLRVREGGGEQIVVGASSYNTAGVISRYLASRSG